MRGPMPEPPPAGPAEPPQPMPPPAEVHGPAPPPEDPASPAEAPHDDPADDAHPAAVSHDDVAPPPVVEVSQDVSPAEAFHDSAAVSYDTPPDGHDGLEAHPHTPKFDFGDPPRPSCPQVLWDSQIDDSQRPRGLTPEAEAWKALQEELGKENNTHPMGDSVPKTVVDSPVTRGGDKMCVISDDESDDGVARNLMDDLQAVDESASSGQLLKQRATEQC